MRIRKTTPGVLFSLALLAIAAGCGGGGGGGGGTTTILIENPGTELVGIWTGTFSDDVDHYTVSLEIDAGELIREEELGFAFTTWGEESIGLDIGNGDFTEAGPDEFTFIYDTFDQVTGQLVDTVSGTLFLVEPGYAEGTFETTSGTFGEFSLALSNGFTSDLIAGSYSMSFSDADTRELFYLGEVVFDGLGNVVDGAGSYLTDDLEGDIDPGAGFWPVTGGYLELIDPEVGYYEGELYFAAPDDTIGLGGFLGLDFYVFAGTFEDVLGAGLFNFVPLD
jgi:hypothetical protein